MNSNIRSTKINLRYKNSRTHKTYNLNSRITSFTYTDVATGEGDTVEVTLDNTRGKFLGAYYPGKNDRMKCSIQNKRLRNGKNSKVNCENFHVDTLSFDGNTSCTIGGISTPKNSGFSKTPRTKTWKKTTLKSIAKQIAKNAGITLHYSAGNIKIKSVEQSNTTNCSFLYSLCQTYGVAMKIYSNRLVLFLEKTYENKKAIATIKRTDIIENSFSADIELIPSYTGFKFYTENDDKKTTYWEKYSIKPIIYTNIGKCDSKSDGYLKGRAAVNEENKTMKVITFEVMGNSKFIATACFYLKGYGRLNGKYYITQVTHKYDTSSGYTCEIEARRVQQRLGDKMKKV